MDASADGSAYVSIDVIETTPVLRLRVEGVLDTTAGDALAEAAAPAIAQAVTQVEVDCARLRFCDSGGLRSFIVLRNAMGKEGSVTLHDASPTLVKLLEITGLVGRFEVEAAPEA